MPENATAVACNWKEGSECQFQHLQESVQEHKGRYYCRAHLPSDASDPDKTDVWVQNLIDFEISHGRCNFTGMNFPDLPMGSAFRFNPQNAPLRQLELRHCTFGTGRRIVNLVVVWPHMVSLSNSNLSPIANLSISTRMLVFENNVIQGGITVVGMTAMDRVSFHGTDFGAYCRFSEMKVAEFLWFQNCIFGGAPEFVNCTFPSRFTFQGSKFRQSAQKPFDEGTYRDLRNIFNEQRSRDWEGYFYALEKRCHRRSLSWSKPANWIQRMLSFLYDMTSEYGQNYVRPILILMAIQACFGVGYSIASDRWEWKAIVDESIVLFTLSQLTKPFEVLSAQFPDSPWYAAVLGTAAQPSPHRLYILVACLAHSILSLSMVTLTFLSLRWRFRRD